MAKTLPCDANSKYASRRDLLRLGLAAGMTGAFSASAAAGPARPPHVILLGDSVLDNAAYVPAGLEVIAQVRRVLPAGSEVSLLAVDGSVTDDVVGQLEMLPASATFLVLSSGGNDALHDEQVLNGGARSIADAMGQLATVRDVFRASYKRMLDRAERSSVPLALCTIYDPRFADAERRRVSTVALSIFNDCITREASARAVPLIDLRVICNEDEDFSTQIEPSPAGGSKIAKAIAGLLLQHSGSKAT